MDLGELTFLPSEMFPDQQASKMPIPHVPWSRWADWSARHANRVLSEKLRCATMVPQQVLIKLEQENNELERRCRELEKKLYDIEHPF